MSLVPGSRLGPYEIVSPLGAGGMGEVYRARDTRLSRAVAVKVLPARLSLSVDARQRFEREARVISQLSHPHICALYDVGQQDGTDYIVMELVDGETLAARLTKGPLPLPQLLRLGVEVADALDEAHRQGIVHRDLKPGNVMLTPSGAKLLDFGLAKPLPPPLGPNGMSQSPTVSAVADLTREGALLGTLQYLAPEQLEGHPADARSDIFALGVTLYEAATGRKPFAGETYPTLASAILGTQPPPISTVRPGSPSALDRLVQICLARDPERRWRTAHDVGLQLAAMAEERSAAPAPAGPAPRPARFRWFAWAVAAVALAVAVATALHRPRAAVDAVAMPVRFSVPPPPGRTFVETYETVLLALSPDGSKLAFVAREPKGSDRLWLRPLSEVDARPLEGTDGAATVFWSPDGRSLAFVADGKLKRLDLPGGTPIPVCDVPRGIGLCGTWGRDGQILYGWVGNTSLYRVSMAGGKPEEAVRAKAGESVGWPRFLPDGERFLYLEYHPGIGGGELMLAGPGLEPRPVVAMASTFDYVDPGYLVFVRDGTLLGQRFDPVQGRVSGEPFAIAEHVHYFLSTARATFAASRSGVLAYASESDRARLVWFDRSGRELGDAGTPSNYSRLRLSPDDRQVLFDRAQPGTGTFDLWSLDLARGIENRLTSDPGTEIGPLWLPGGKSLAFSAARGGAPPHLFRKDLVTGAEEELVPGSMIQIADDVSPDGRSLAFTERTAKDSFDVFLLPLSGGGKESPLLHSPFSEADLRFSPDGRFVAFDSDESGQSEVYIAPFPGAAERTRVSSGGGAQPRWSHSGRELFYLSDDGHLVAVPVRTAPALGVGRPVPLFSTGGRTAWTEFEVASDGRRFLAVVPTVIAAEQPLTVLVNWPAQRGS
jgi:eukaryotic-like serine/threonine-protein kinase